MATPFFGYIFVKGIDIIQKIEYNNAEVLKMKYLSTTQAGELLGLSARRIAILCEQGRIPGAQKVGVNWIIPENAEKPTDARIKSGKYIKTQEGKSNG